MFSDPYAYEFVKHPVESLQVQGGDCDDASVLLASLMQSIGMRNEILSSFPAMYLSKSSIPDAPKSLQNIKRIGLTQMRTCEYCEFW